ncbi:MAG: hypothetical protein JWP82_497 [Humibacillus sp.]|nr:hypothetical protein [Humibacillus sp.]
MSHPTEDELVDLALRLDADPSVTAHAETCDRCAGVVAELRRTAHLVSSLPASPGWQAPPASVWDRIADEVGADTADEVGAGTADTHRAGPDDPSGADHVAPVRALDPARRHTAGSSPDLVPRRRAVGWGALLAAASLAVGLLAGRAVWQPAQPADQSVSEVALATLDTKQDGGRATVVRSGAGLDLTVATSKTLDQKDGYLEVWLLNRDGKRMVSVGVLAPGDSTFPISQRLIDEGYVIVDISREPFDDKVAHSGNSLLRGRLPA